ncbi:MAG TPA: MBL fold metallo-hydrolase [Sphingomicrobium sp.]
MSKLSLLFAAAMILVAAAPNKAPGPPGPVFVTLGTAGGPLPNSQRSQPANAVVIGNDAILFDTGDGAAERMAASGIRLAQVNTVFLSHLHLDHTAGLAGVIGLRWMIGGVGPLHVYGPPGTRELVDGLRASMLPAQRVGYGFDDGFGSDPIAIEVVELADGQNVEPTPGVRVRVAENTHYSFSKASAAASRGTALSFRIEAQGRSIVYTGDTGPSEAVTKLAKGADLLVSEVQDLDALLASIRRQGLSVPPPILTKLTEHLRRHHISPEDVGRMATDAGVGGVVLTHLGPVLDQSAADALFLPKVRTTYKGPVVVAADLGRY